jgi:hypothetical protein
MSARFKRDIGSAALKGDTSSIIKTGQCRRFGMGHAACPCIARCQQLPIRANQNTTNRWINPATANAALCRHDGSAHPSCIFGENWI